MKITTQLLKLGAYVSVLIFIILGLITIPSLLRSPLILKVQNKSISGHDYTIEGIMDNGGKVIAGYSESFYNKAQIGDTIRFNTSYRILVKNGHTESIYIRDRVWHMLLMLLSALLPLLVFFPNSKLLRRRYSYWIIGACELVNIFFLTTFFMPL